MQSVNLCTHRGQFGNFFDFWLMLLALPVTVHYSSTTHQ